MHLLVHQNLLSLFQYQKPQEVLAMERAVFEELKTVKTIRNEDLPPDCKQS